MTKAPLFSHRRAGRRCALRPFRDRLTDDSRGSGSQRQAEPTRLGAQVSSLRGSTRPFLERLIQIKRDRLLCLLGLCLLVLVARISDTVMVMSRVDVVLSILG
jgi:hypothetical protein